MPRHPSHQRRNKATLPPDTRIYAIGDIHGRADLLQDVIARIDEDIHRRPIAFAGEVYVGDYIDRGADSKGVIDLLAARLVQNHAICLRGNHEALMEEFLYDNPAALDGWRQLGGLATLMSYGVAPTRGETAEQVQHAFCAAFPTAHQLFLRCLRNNVRCGDFLFVHAGVRPGVSLNAQNPNDLMWIRDEFLNSAADHGLYVVHGHTPVPHADIRDNRINIDTGAWRSGVLTCIAIEGTDIIIL
ncbi:serine/threonine protein phosphatase [Rhodopseudomonas boonkerdii]|uniref:metallophosphoesterase n=1 Tax=Rhodopseudomonas boonkerdii TaxID=475937 RepID=UPI001E28B04D|nr:metallophosphoesterase [Rhodopseudomonas boonkerdii]UGV27596.1 serine/threonine protein phosphatase [Rhodopseudomonas boonkerdii]